MSLYRATGGTGMLLAALGTGPIAANPSRLTLLISTAAVGKFAVYRGNSPDPLMLLGVITTQRGFVYYDNVRLGTIIQGDFTMQNLGATTEIITWIETVTG